MDVFEALYTTRAMRRVRPDPIPEEVQASILDAAVRAPSGGNQQGWRFLLVDDPEVKADLAPLYKDSIDQLWKTVYKDALDKANVNPGDPESAQFLRVQRSAQHLADHFAEVPLYLFGFTRGDPSGGSIFPAVWSAMLAARAHGVGASITTVLGYFHPEETYALLGVPPDKGWHMACCVSFGYPTGRWGLAKRRPAHEVSYRNRWGNDIGLDLSEPRWTPDSA